MMQNGQISSWLGLLQALDARFVVSQYEDPTSICLNSLTKAL